MTRMPENTSSENKRIARNTLMLYLRMFLTMGIGLYTSRLILQVLGITDYGVNNAVAGVVGLFGFITGTLANATTRFITFSLGKGNEQQEKETFANLKAIYYILALLIFVLAETIGVWFFYTYLVIPPDRVTAAFVVLQLSIASTFLGLICVPYSTAIIAHEKMSAFAWMSILDAVLKLLVCYLLMISPFDKLIFYASLGFCISCIDRLIYAAYCNRHFSEVKVRPHIYKAQFREILVFSAWTLNGNIAWIGYTQGLNMLLNMFFGPAVNAARGVALQVQGVLGSFSSGFQTAVNPQLTKSYAQGRFDRMHELLHESSKLSFYLMYFLSLPVFLELPVFLDLWLDKVPDHTVYFARIILVYSVLYTLTTPILISVHATANLKKFQLVEGALLLTIVPVSYVVLKFFHGSPESVFWVLLIIEMLTQCARLYIVLPLIHDSIKAYVVEVILPICKVVALSFPLPLIAYKLLPDNYYSFFIVIIFSILLPAVTIIGVGCNESERSLVINKIKNIIHKVTLR